ncbi:diguanylate cyclase domain-containing protein [Thiomicrorhabdus sp.]|uniref:sensor domain-containing diguanylate cyclase n=1 Tax=Thiomicrorhabdus sp. TaxID=2039724 RepID=UPI00356A4C3F
MNLSYPSLPSLEILFDNLADAVYLIDPESSKIIWCNRAGYLDLGYEKEEILNHSVLSLQKDVQGLPHWDDVVKAIMDCNVFTFIGRHSHKDGSEMEVEINTSHFQHQNKLFFLSVARNINKRMALEKDLHSRNHRIWYALNEATDGMWEWEIETGHVFFSPQLKNMLGYGPDEMQPNVNTWITNIHPDDMDRVSQILEDHLQGKRRSYEAEYRLKNRNGHYLWVHDKGKVCERDDKGNPTHVVGMVENITERKQLQFQLEALASNDVLTQLPNRREGEIQAARHLELAKRNGRPMCLAVVDFDDFKQINDLFGHQKGDEVLIFGAELLRTTLRKSDFIYRWGGEEFVILFPDTDLEQIEHITDKIHRTFQEADWKNINITPMTVSIGIACYPDHGTDFGDLIKQADTAVYIAKAQGRNQTVHANLPTEAN